MACETLLVEQLLDQIECEPESREDGIVVEPEHSSIRDDGIARLPRRRDDIEWQQHAVAYLTRFEWENDQLAWSTWSSCEEDCFGCCLPWWCGGSRPFRQSMSKMGPVESFVRLRRRRHPSWHFSSLRHREDSTQSLWQDWEVHVGIAVKMIRQQNLLVGIQAEGALHPSQKATHLVTIGSHIRSTGYFFKFPRRQVSQEGINRPIAPFFIP